MAEDTAVGSDKEITADEAEVIHRIFIKKSHFSTRHLQTTVDLTQLLTQ